MTRDEFERLRSEAINRHRDGGMTQADCEAELRRLFNEFWRIKPPSERAA